jgi:hypothetical protein
VIEPVRAYLTTRALEIPLRRYVVSLSGIAQATALMAAGLGVAGLGLTAAGVPAGVRLLVLVLLGGCIYAAACFWRAPELIAEIRGVSGRRRAREPRVEALDPGLIEV